MPRKPEGPWWFNGRGYYCTIDGKRINLKTTDAKEAERRWHIEMSGRGQETPTEGELTVKELFGLFLRSLKAESKDATFQWYKLYIDSFAASIKGDLAVSQLRPLQFDVWLQANYKPSQYRAPIRAIKRVFNWAIEKREIKENPLAGIKKPREKRRKGLITPEMKETIRAIPKDQAFKDLLQLLETTGCRVEEARILEARHFNESLGSFVIPTEERKRGEHFDQDRIIPLSEDVIQTVKRLIDRHPTGKLYRNKYGSPWTKNAIGLRFRRIRGRKEMQGKVPPNLCGTHYRHALLTAMVANGENLDLIRQVAGHQGFETLEKTYLHSQDVKVLRAAMERVRATQTPAPPRELPDDA